MKQVIFIWVSLMLSHLGDHLNTDFTELDCVLDDDAIARMVRRNEKVNPKPNSSYLITSLENVRPIYRRILELTPRRILVPLIN